MIERQFELENREGDILIGDVRIPDVGGTYPCIVFMHSLKTSRNMPFFKNLFRELSYHGFITVIFDTAAHGDSSGDFRDLTPTSMQEDLQDVLDKLQTFEQVSSLGLIGHGIGGVIGIHEAIHNRNIKALATIGSWAHIDELKKSYFSERELAELNTSGYALFPDFSELRKEFIKDLDAFDILEDVEKISCPFLAVHGMDDRRVPFSHAKELSLHCPADKDLSLLEGCDHVFGTKEMQDKLFSSLLRFFQQYLH